ncbi:LytTR family DNA-binding domain-containing protein [Paenibacillus sp. PK3_47]|uniref:LytR/AlgR family response regulator transcription factor n=1 Tax=Paenibacillus sp. PK3_47 TaxID=2072642 RepID=UPI00201DC4C8|nr:LytTR family DNA-binding domain-containing protein [Paenibacillus sp. PK3_47]
MIHIAVCDDDPQAAGLIENLILSGQHYCEETLEVSLFYSGESFAEALQHGCIFDLVYMDIEMEGMDGITAGQMLRGDDENDFVQLMYISSHEQYHLQLFDVRPSGFIKKPVNQEVFMKKLIPALQKAVRTRQNGKLNFLPVQQKGKELMIPFREIVYLESRIRRITLVTKEGELQYYGVLKEEAGKLPASYFTRIHQSYIVNLYYVKEISAKRIILLNGSELPVSEKNSLTVRKAYLSFRGALI